MYQEQQTPDSLVSEVVESIVLTPGIFKGATGEAIKKIGQVGIQENIGKIQESMAIGESTFRRYFAVSTKSVVDKIKKLIFPFNVRNWARSVEEGKVATPRENSNLPDFYIPVVFGFAFILLTSIFNGLNGTFTFEKVTHLFLKYVSFLIIDVVLTKLLFFVMNLGQIEIAMLFADFGTMSFYLTISSLFCWNSFFRFVSLCYCGACSAFWMIRSLKSNVVIQTDEKHNMTYTIIGVAALQAIFPFLLVDKITSVATN